MTSALCSHLQLHLRDGFAGVETLGARPGAIENCVASIQAESVLHLLLTFCAHGIPRICHPPICSHKGRRAKVLILVPPVARTRGRTARAQDTFIPAVKLFALINGLEVLLSIRRWCGLEPWLDGLVLLVELGHVGNEILDDVHVWQWIYLGLLSSLPINTAQACQSVLPVNVHRATAADPFTAASSKRQCRVHLILDLENGIQDHRPRLVEVDGILLKEGLLAGLIRVPSVYLECLVQRFLLGRR